jgi:hypothetical protein
MSFFGIPKIPTGPLRRALGLPSTGKNFVDKIVSMAPSSSQAELKQINLFEPLDGCSESCEAF